MFKILVAEDEPKSRSALVSRLRGILGDAALIEELIALNGTFCVSYIASVKK